MFFTGAGRPFSFLASPKLADAISHTRKDVFMEAAVSRVDSGISFHNAEGREVRELAPASLCEAIVFEVYSPYPVAEQGQELRSSAAPRRYAGLQW